VSAAPAAFDTAILTQLANGQRPSETAIETALTSILGGGANDAQIAALLMGLETLGVTTQDVRAGTRVMRAHMIPAPGCIHFRFLQPV